MTTQEQRRSHGKQTTLLPTDLSPSWPHRNSTSRQADDTSPHRPVSFMATQEQRLIRQADDTSPHTPVSMTTQEQHLTASRRHFSPHTCLHDHTGTAPHTASRRHFSPQTCLLHGHTGTAPHGKQTTLLPTDLSPSWPHRNSADRMTSLHLIMDARRSCF